MNLGTLKVISNGDLQKKQRKNGEGDFYIFTGYVDLGGLYPEKMDFFVFEPTDGLGRGEWNVPVTARMYNGRLRYDLDFNQAQAVVAKPVTTATSTTTKATA